MRFLSRLGTWLRPQSAEGILPAVMGPTTHAPTTEPEAFRRALVATAEAAVLQQSAELAMLDPTVYVLAIPSVAELDADAEDALSRSVDNALDTVQAQGRSFSSLTWSALREARPSFQPSYLEWAKDEAAWFEGEVSLLFFIDTGEISRAMAEAVVAAGFRARMSRRRPLVLVEDAHFRAHIGINALVAESVWTADGPHAVVARRARALGAEFRAFQMLLYGLRRRFPDAQIDIEKTLFRAQTTDETYLLDYRHLSAAIRASGRVLDEWLAPICLKDLVADRGAPGLMLRSPAYLRARPNVLAEDCGGYARVAVRSKDGRITPVDAGGPNDLERLAYYAEETSRQIGTLEFEAHAFVPPAVRDAGERIVVLVGDGVASIAIDPALVRAAIEEFFPAPDWVRVRACAEDVVIIGDRDADASLFDDANELANTLEHDLVDDRSDRLQYDEEIELPSLGAGRFTLHFVDDEVLELLAQAESSGLLPGQREHLRGVALTLLGRIDRAVETLERALRTQRDDGDVNIALGRALMLQGEPERAVPFVERAGRTAPQNAEIANTLGLARFGAGEAAEAISAFERANALEPNEPAFLVNLGRCLVETERFGEARETLLQALGMAPRSAEAHATMALLCQRTGDETRAKEHARQALSLDPDDASMRDLLQAMKTGA